MNKLLIKVVKAAMKGSRKIKGSHNWSGVTVSDGDHSLHVVVTDPIENEQPFDSIAELELLGISSTIEKRSASCISGKCIDRSEWEDIDWASGATDPDSTRYALGGVCFDGNTAVATDGRRMHVVNIASDFGDGKKQIVPKRSIVAVGALLRAFNEDCVWLEFKDNFAVFMTEHFTFSTRLIEGRFPNWKQVVPDQGNAEKVLLKEALVKEVKAELAKHKLLVKTGRIEAGEPYKVEIKGEVYKATLDANYFLDAMHLFDGSKDFYASLCGKNSPVVFGDDWAFAVVMTLV